MSGTSLILSRSDGLSDVTITGLPSGGGSPLEVTTEDISNISFTEGLTAAIDLTTVNVAVDTGISVPANTVTILANWGASTDGATAGRDLPWFAMPIEEWERLDGVDVGDTPTQGNARLTRTWRDADITTVGGVMARQIWIGKGNNGNIFVWSDNTGWDIYPFRVRFEIHVPITVVTGVTGEGGGGGGTTVVANPTGTDGDNLNRISIGGTNYVIVGGGGTTLDIAGLAEPSVNPAGGHRHHGDRERL